MDIIAVPTLSTDGWVRSSTSKADFLMAHFLESEKSQTAFYGGKVASFQWILQQYSGDIILTVQNTRETLAEYFGRYFADVKVNVDQKPETPNSPKIIMTIDMNFTDDQGIEYSLNRVIDILDSKFVKVISNNNTGTLA